MDHSHEHQLEPIILGHSCKLWKCSCGTYHLQIQHVSLKISPETFVEVSRTLGLASEPLLAGEYSN